MAIFDRRHVLFDNANRRLFVAGLFVYFGFSEFCYGFDWRATPSLSASETFTDNINLANVDKKSGFVTEVTPGLSINGSYRDWETTCDYGF